MKGKWAAGIPPRNFTWIIRDHLAVSERPGGFGVNHRRVRRTEEIIWLRVQGFGRVISLLPDWHLCVLRASQIVETLPEYFDRCTEIPTLVTWISGPSATADIEMIRIKGVHGPRFLNVIVVKDDEEGNVGKANNLPA